MNEAQILKDMINAKRDNEESEMLYIAHLVGEHIELPCNDLDLDRIDINLAKESVT